MSDDHEELVRRFVEATNRAVVARFVDEVYNLKRVQAVDDLVAPTHASDDPAMPGVRGPRDIRLVAEMFHLTFPDWHEQIEDMIVEGDKVAVRITATGTHVGYFLDIPPTGRQVTITGHVIYQLAEGQIVAHWAMFDMLGLMRQLGYSPRTGFPIGPAEEAP